jgi:hypothetical protein
MAHPRTGLAAAGLHEGQHQWTGKAGSTVFVWIWLSN